MVFFAIAAALPLRLSGWLGWFRGPAMTIIAPISTPLAAVSSWLRPGERVGASAAPEGDQELRRQAEFYKGEYLQAQQQISELEQIIQALQDGVPMGSRARVRRLEAVRVGADLSSGTILVSRGTVHGVTAGTVAVATASPQHLIGVVTSVGPTVSTVHAITDRGLSPPLLESILLGPGLIGAGEALTAPRVQLRPVGDGTLIGEIGVNDAARVQPGFGAYLDDPSWPTSAQRLIVGRVVRTEPTDRPLFLRLVVRPDLEPMRVRGVVLRIPVEGSEAPAPANSAGVLPGPSAPGSGGER